MSTGRPSVLILYGSQTGNAEEVAYQIGRDARRHHFGATQCSALDDFPVSQLIDEELVVFVCATAGEGDAPDNMRRFWRFLLRKNLPADSLCKMKMAVFGLGDSSYAKFNLCAKKLYKRLVQLGATAVHNLGLADDQHPLGVCGALDPWLVALWSRVAAWYPVPTGLAPLPATELAPPRFDVQTSHVRLSVADLELATVTAAEIPSRACPFEATVKSNTRLTAIEHSQDVRHIVLNISQSKIRYSPGDVAYTLPKNTPDSVVRAAGLLGLGLDDFLCVCSRQNGEQPPGFFCNNDGTLKPRRIRDVLENYLDITAVPRRYFFELLAVFASDAREAIRLAELSSAEGLDDLLAYCTRVRRTSLEVLEDFGSVQRMVPVEYLLELFRPIQPRAFSISSAEQAYPSEVHLTVAVVRYSTRMSTPRVGLCSNWLSKLSIGEKVPLWVSSGTFKLPPANTPLVMVGPGTGCAPFRSCIQYRISIGSPINVLFFGNRKQDGDFLHGVEWNDYTEKGLLSLHTAFSRDQPDKIYVQHRMKESSAMLWGMIESRSATVMVAGSAGQMPKDVREALVDIASREGGFSESEALSYVTTMEKKGRLQVEVW